MYQFDLSQKDVAIQGTSESADASDEVISRFQLRLDMSAMLADSFKVCQESRIRILNITYNDWAARKVYDLKTTEGFKQYKIYRNFHIRTTCREVLQRDAAGLLTDFERYLRTDYNSLDVIDRRNVEANVTEMKNFYSQGQDAFISRYYYRYYTEVQLFDQAALQDAYDIL